MNTHADKTLENKRQTVANSVSQKRGGGKSTFQFVDNRPEVVAQRKLQEIMNNSPKVQQLKTFQEKANNSPRVNQVTQLQAMAENNLAKQHPIQKVEDDSVSSFGSFSSRSSIEYGSDEDHDTEELAKTLTNDRYMFPFIVDIDGGLKEKLPELDGIPYAEKLNICRNGRHSDKKKYSMWGLALKLYDNLPKENSHQGKQAKFELDQRAIEKGWGNWRGLSNALYLSGLKTEPELPWQHVSAQNQYPETNLKLEKSGFPKL